MKAGIMWGRKEGKESYMPVQSLRYLENQTLPDSVTRLFPLLDLDRRKGAAKVKRLFGVQSLTEDEVESRLRVTATRVSSIMSEEIDELKPYIYALRVEEDSDQSEAWTRKETQSGTL